MTKAGLIQEDVDRNQPLSTGFPEITEDVHVCEGVHNYSDNLEDFKVRKNEL